MTVRSRISSFANSNGNPPEKLQHLATGWDGLCPPDYDTVQASIAAVPPPCVLNQSDEIVTGSDGVIRRHVLGYRILRVTVLPTRTVISGSITRAIHGTNATRLDLTLVRPLLEDVAAFLQIPLHDVLEASVRRLDVGVNLTLAHPIHEVTGAICPAPRMRTARFAEASVAVVNTRRQLAFYDKRKERARKQKGFVDPRYGDGHLLRIEHRYLKGVDKQVGERVTLGRLCDADFHRHVGRLLRDAVLSLALRRNRRVDYQSGVRGLVGAYALHGVDALGGLDAALMGIKAAQDAGTLTRSQACAMRKKLRELHRAPAFAQDTPVVDDLLAAVRAAFACLEDGTPPPSFSLN